MDLKASENNSKNTYWGRVFAMIFVSIISVTSMILAMFVSILSSFGFAIAAFSCIAIVSYIYSKSSIYKGFNKYKKPGFTPKHQFNNTNERPERS